MEKPLYVHPWKVWVGGTLLVCIPIAFGLWLVGDRWPKSRCQYTHPKNSSLLEAEAQPLIDALNQFRTENGKYPLTLSEANLNEQSSLGPWRYSSTDGTAFCLALGDYGTCLWESTYCTENNLGWYHDG